MNKILVCNPPAYLYDDTRHFMQAGSRWSFSMEAEKGNHDWPHYQPYPFNLGYAASILKREGFKVDAFDGCALDMDEKDFISRVVQTSPDTIIIEIPTVSFPLVMRLLEDLKREIDCKIIVAGPHVTAIPSASKYEIITREWEKTLSSDRLEFKDYPFPDRKFFPNEQYSNFEFERPSAQMISSKGCLGFCSFCMERHVICEVGAVRTREPANIIDEMSYLKEMGAKQIWFDDMSITYKKGHVDGMCHEILDRQLDLPWTCMGDMNCNEKTLELMSKAGCKGLAFGVETINPKALKLANKRFVTVEKTQNFVETLKRHGIYSVATFIIGLPGENLRTTLRTIRFATTELDADSIQFAIATPLPGTPFYRMCKEKGWLITDDWTMYDGSRHSVVSYPELEAFEIEELFGLAMDLRRIRKLGFRK